MKRSLVVAACSLALLAVPALAAAPANERIAILSTTDVQGKTAPCGCKIPRGGFARRATFADSLRANYDQVMLVENGGFFPVEDIPEIGLFQMEALRTLGARAAGVGERELKFGLEFLRANARSRQVPLTCANLVEAASGRPAFEPWRLEKVGAARIGVFALFPAGGDLGPAGDSLRVEDPAAAARRAIAELRRKGATAVVLLSQLGKVGTEDLVATVDGVDVAIAGNRVPILPRARTIRNTVTLFGGEQGHYVGRALLTVGPKGEVLGRDGETFSLGPEVADHAGIAKLVTLFEADLAARHGPRAETPDPHQGHAH